MGVASGTRAGICVDGGVRRRAAAAALTFPISSSLISSRRSDASAVGFWMKSTAPASSAFSASSPASLATLTMTIGSGLRAICSVTKPTPSRLGMMRSQVIDIGLELGHLIQRFTSIPRDADDFKRRAAR